jgi:hypothetical protein
VWAQSGAPVLGLTRTSERHAELRQRGIVPALGSAVGVLTPDDALLLVLPGSTGQHAAVEALVSTPSPARTVLVSSI